ncbi:gliding motility-associated-like protein [Mucilaginibacter gracilis]|uniref:Gliding motility-associated-like protein n=1 Tax=Mucilaginibacter gracilis TaxID=423350 RepID=A0A495IXU5_9SPHI|nr:gliding motility-associated C-terminal domain-containing protein [Mucilaginibacter gracilis]RKR80864.1 gliding motility-associated-like protein [Mucilaginibacter gracilis]
MHFKKTLFAIAFILLLVKAASADTFVVTEKADAGPGTLREALGKAQANGTTVQDIITFNLAGSLTSDRTIRLKSQLPLVTANVIIDGTTQPSIAFGVSGARVIIEPETSPAYFSGLVIAGDYSSSVVTQGVEIYGLYIRNFAQINNLITYNTSQGSGITFQGNASGVKIGAPGKGNIICGTVNAIYSGYYYYSSAISADITIQGNIIGLAEDGKTLVSNINGINVNNFSTITIGGDDAKMGNVIASGVTNINVNRSNYYYTATLQTITIKNNKIGTDYSGTIDYKQDPLFLAAAFVKTYGVNIVSGYTNSLTSVDIAGNVISGQIGYGVFISNATYSIKNNKIGTDVTGTADLGNYEGIRSDASAIGTIGGTGTDANYIGHNTYGVEVVNSSQVLITQNSIFCNSGLGIAVTSSYYQVPYVKVLTYRSDMVAGVATPNSAIELFYSDDCAGSLCQGKEYITTVQSDGSGKWSYSAAISRSVIATATTAQKNTSPFSSLAIAATDYVKKEYTCAYNGSLTIIQPRDGILFHWDRKEEDGSFKPVGDTQNIDQLLPGVYQLTVQYPGGCQKATQLFEIFDQRITIQQLITPTPACRQITFPVSAIYSGGTGTKVLRWVNDAGVTVAYGSEPNAAANVPAGKYTLQITDALNCAPVISKDTITIKALPGPDFDLSHIDIHAAECGFNNGHIFGIKTKPGLGLTKTTWRDNKQNIFSYKLDVDSLPPGIYTLTLSDDGTCPYSMSFTVGETQSVFVNTNIYTTRAYTCNGANGANGLLNVPLSSITNASEFTWTGPNGAALPQFKNKLILTGLLPGSYNLHAVNPTSGCFGDGTFNVPNLPPDVFTVIPHVKDVTCGQGNNGSITTTFGVVTPATYAWTDQNGILVSSRQDYLNAKPGKYTLTVTDKGAGCTSVLLRDIVVVDIPLMSATNTPTTTNDQCGQMFGAISAINMTGGIPPYTYHWTDANGKPFGGSTTSLSNLGKGDYSLRVTDQTSCDFKIGPFHIDDIPFTPPAPELSNQRICDPQQLVLFVKNPQSGTNNLYKLYQNYDDAVPAQTSTNGQFTLNVKRTSDYYVSFNVGTCESARTKVHVEVILVDVSMGNTITPNGDGYNDTWKITGLEKFPGTTVQIYNRSGQLIFESTDYPKAFDGTFKGNPLPTGSYYYVINLHVPCTLISGNLTIVR